MKSNEEQSRDLRGNTVLVLDGAGAWAIDAGSVAVFHSKVEDGVPAGPRRYLFTCRAGEVLFGSANGCGDGALLAAALEDSKLHELPLARLADSVRAAQSASIAAVQSWVEKLTGVLVRDTPRVAVENIGSQEQIQLTAGQVIGAPGRGVNWFRVEDGQVHLLNSREISFGPDSGPFPVGSEAWLQADGPTRLRRFDTGAIPDAATLAGGLAQIHRHCLHELKQAEQRELSAEAERLSRRQHLQQLDACDAVGELAGVLGAQQAIRREETDLLTALSAIGRQIGLTFRPPAKSEDLRRLGDPLEAIARASRVRMRRVQLRREWWRSDCGLLLGHLEDGHRPVALLPAGSSGYELFDPQDQTRRHVDEATAERLAGEAVTFYRPFPHEITGVGNLARFASGPLIREVALIAILSIAGASLGMLIPQATRLLIDQAIPDADRSLVLQLALALLAVTCGQGAFLFVQGVVTLRLQISGTANLQSATWDRLLRLPTTFFRRFSSGELLNRSMMVTEISQEVGATALRSIVTGTMSLLNLGLLLYYSAKLALMAVVIALVSSAFTAAVALAVRKKAFVVEQMHGRLFGFIVQLINGVAKLRIAGAEQRAYNQWARKYARQLRLTSAMRGLQDLGTLFNFVLPVLSSMLLFYFAAKLVMAAALGADTKGMTMGTFLAFSAAFGAFVSGTTSASDTLVQIMDSVGKGRLIKPIFEAEPEVGPGRVDPGRLSGNVTFQHVTFRYRDDGPLILQDVSLHIEPGEFIALVGPSGSGKSTIFRLLLGFETAEFGTISYDNQDLQDLDVTAVRRQIGVVLQSIRVNACSIFEFIAGGSPLTLDEAWEVARDVGLADEIKELPMEMHTIISEGGTNFSGGQRQRLVIARALAQNPRILLFDEATSALDNRTQRIVSESIRRRKVTRMAVAHRLSTIRDADRIYVLEKGQVRQVGAFDQLASSEGLFQRMMLRQVA